MSISDPLLKSLKGCVLELRNQVGPVTDFHDQLEPLCDTIEKIFQKGLRLSSRWFNKADKCDFWTWVSSLPQQNSIQRVNPIFSQAVAAVNESQKVQTKQGRGRLYIRTALAKKVSPVPIEMLRVLKLDQTWYDPVFSIIGNEILQEILLSLLLELGEITFNLRLKNASFLDETWKLPLYLQFEFVPCKDLGIHFQYVGSRAVVIGVDKNSVAGEDGKICVGDVLDDLYGESLKGAKRGKIFRLIKDNQGWPIYMGVVKCKYKSGKLFANLTDTLIKADIDPRDIHDLAKPNPNEPNDTPPIHALLTENDRPLAKVPIHGPEGSAVYDAIYVGRVNLGIDGRVNRVEDSVSTVLQLKDKRDMPVCVELNETDIVVTSKSSGEVLYKHSYTEVSACGRRTDKLLNFAYIAGETTCSLAKDFYCYVFEAANEDESKTILCSIAQGFGRTQWCL